MITSSQKLLMARAGAKKEYYASVLLNTDSATSSSDFVDSGIYNLTLTPRNADASVSTTEFKYGVSSAYFANDATGVSFPSTNLLNLDADFTIESWCYKSGTTAKVIVGSLYPGINNQVQFDQGGANNLGIYHPSTGWESVDMGSSPDNTWFHVAITREGSTLRYYLDGVYKGTNTSSETYQFSQGAIGALAGYWDFGWVGYLDDFRIVKGLAVYTTTSSFTPPTAALSAGPLQREN